LAARGSVRRERLFLHWSNFLHAYFYGNWGVKVPIILQDREFDDTVTIPGSSSEIQEMIAGDRSGYLFDFGEKSVEIFVLGAVVFSQSRLHQTPEAKAVVHSHHSTTMRALVVLVRGR
jgi:hypothetical protein